MIQSAKEKYLLEQIAKCQENIRTSERDIENLRYELEEINRSPVTTSHRIIRASDGTFLVYSKNGAYLTEFVPNLELTWSPGPSNTWELSDARVLSPNKSANPVETAVYSPEFAAKAADDLFKLGAEKGLIGYAQKSWSQQRLGKDLSR